MVAISAFATLLCLKLENCKLFRYYNQVNEVNFRANSNQTIKEKSFFIYVMGNLLSQGMLLIDLNCIEFFLKILKSNITCFQ